MILSLLTIFVNFLSLILIIGMSKSLIIGNKRGGEREEKLSRDYLLFLLGIGTWLSTTIILVVRNFNRHFQLFGLNVLSLWEYIIENPLFLMKIITFIILFSLAIRLLIIILLRWVLGKEERENPLAIVNFLCRNFQWIRESTEINYEIHQKIFFKITGGRWGVNTWTLIFHIPLLLLIFAIIFDIKYNGGELFLTIFAISFFFAFGLIGDIHFKLLFFTPFWGGEDINHGGGYLPPDKKPENVGDLGPPMRTKTRFGVTLREGIQYERTTENIYRPAVRAWTRATYTKVGVSVVATTGMATVLADTALKRSEREMIEGEYRICEAQYGESAKEMRENVNSPGHKRIIWIDNLEKERKEINAKPIASRLYHNGGRFLWGSPEYKETDK